MERKAPEFRQEVKLREDGIPDPLPLLRTALARVNTAADQATSFKLNLDDRVARHFVLQVVGPIGRAVTNAARRFHIAYRRVFGSLVDRGCGPTTSRTSNAP
jgi:hypothetical protein